MKHNTIKLNVFCSLLLQVVTIICGFVVPRIILETFGSNINGLVNSLSQFLNYVTLLEGGVSGVIMASLYKPLAKNDIDKISGIVKATRKFFKQIACIYVVYTIILAFVYPLFVETNQGYAYTVSLCIVLASNLFIQYFYSLTYKLLLTADRKVYFVSLTQIAVLVINTIAVVITAKLFEDILIVKIASAIVFILQPILYNVFVNKKYNIKNEVKPDEEAISQRWDGFGQNFAFFIHTNTDVVVLTIFSSLEWISVYSVFLMIVNAMKGLVSSISSAIIPSIGKVLADSDEISLKRAFSKYEFSIQLISTILFSSCMILLVPFILVYTSGITDANYNQVWFGLIIAYAELVYCLRDPYVNITYAAGCFKQTAKYAYIEAIINIGISVILVRHMGIIGVAIGTLVGMLYRLLAHIVFLKKNIINRSILPALKNIAFFSAISLGLYFIISPIIAKYINSYISFFIVGMITFTICSVVTILGCVVFYRGQLLELIKRDKEDC